MSRTTCKATENIEPMSEHALKLMNEFARALNSAAEPPDQQAAMLGWLRSLDMLLSDLEQLPALAGLKSATLPLEVLQFELRMVRGGSNRDIFKPTPPQVGQQRALNRNQLAFLRACFMASDAYLGAGDNRELADKKVERIAAPAAAAYGVAITADSLPHQRKRYRWIRWQPPRHWTTERTKRWADAMLQDLAPRQR